MQITTPLEGDWRLRRAVSNTNSTTNSPSRFQANNKTNLNRRSLHHQSNGSLHSADSQSSTSPAPSPLPRPATVHSTVPLQLNNQHALQNQSSVTNLLTQTGASSPTGLGKRWNSTGDFVMTSPTNQQSSPTLQSSRFATKSLLNLQSKNGTGSLLKHGWVWCQFHLRVAISSLPILLPRFQHIHKYTTLNFMSISKLQTIFGSGSIYSQPVIIIYFPSTPLRIVSLPIDLLVLLQSNRKRLVLLGVLWKLKKFCLLCRWSCMSIGNFTEKTLNYI